jgi:hypothetical protein
LDILQLLTGRHGARKKDLSSGVLAQRTVGSMDARVPVSLIERWTIGREELVAALRRRKYETTAVVPWSAATSAAGAHDLAAEGS